VGVRLGVQRLCWNTLSGTRIGGTHSGRVRLTGLIRVVNHDQSNVGRMISLIGDDLMVLSVLCAQSWVDLEKFKFALL
jgi:hypothetical protein